MENPKFHTFLIIMLLAITIVGIIDLQLDAPEHWLSTHVLVEVGFILLCLCSATYLMWGWYTAQRSLGQMQSALEVQRTERDVWRMRAKELLKGLGQAIDIQMESWQLTPVEKETALFLLKGYSHKEIARLCEKSERTVRQHAVTIYRKSGLAGRAELAAFFLEDLLLPMDEKEGSVSSGGLEEER